LASNGSPLLLDTSAAIALVDESNRLHVQVDHACKGRVLGLSGHAAFETYSVLTRLPFPARISGQDAARLIAGEFPATVYLSQEGSARLVGQLGVGVISGGATFDALVGACAVEHGLTLLSCDLRAEPTYRALGVDAWLLEG
jgi:predicted nucleic acid-binding protein